MDPVSATASVLGILDILLRTSSALAKWAHNTRHAATERALVAKEASLLSSLLERVQNRVRSTRSDDKWLSDRSELLDQFQAAFKDLCRLIKIDPASGELAQESRFKAAITSAKWTFSKSESFSLLERITRLQHCANALLLDHQSSLLEQISEKQQEVMEDKLRLSILEWLSSLQVGRLLRTISERAVEGSGKWFLLSDAFHTWATGNKRLLWGWGIPGAGKTTLVAILAEHLQRQRASEPDEEPSGIAILFLKYNDREQTLENLLASLLKQLLQGQRTIPPCLLELFEKHASQNLSATAEELFEALSSSVAACRTVYVIVDGLDECTEEVRWPLVETLLELPEHARLMLTSRFLDSMDEEFSQFQQLEIKANKEDIELYTDSQIKRNRNLRRMVQKHHAMRGEIKDKIVKSAEGMFLLAHLHVESLVGAAALSAKHVRKKLDSLPTTLKGTYDEAMSRINGQEEDHMAIAMKSLAWITYAFRPLLLRELQHAIEIEPNSAELDEEALVEGHSIISLCAGLVVIDQDTSEVNLVHYTAKKYFEEVRREVFPGFHATITLSCATYLNLDVLKNAHVRDIVRWYPLACYAVQYMAEHAREHPEETLDPSTLEVICQLFSRPDKRKPLVALLDGLDLINAGFYSSKDAAIRFTTGHVNESDDLGLLDHRSDTMRLDRTLIESGDAGDGDGETASSHPDIWESPIRASQGPEVTALHLAASMGLAKVASMLLRGTPNVDAVDENGNTALTVAMNRGFEKAVGEGKRFRAIVVDFNKARELSSL